MQIDRVSNKNEYYVREEKINNIYLTAKRIFDIIFAITLGVITFPITIIACILVVIESKGNPIYSQTRVGVGSKEFRMYKIRSMRIDAEKNGVQWAEKDDPRITKVGKIIRKLRIDELPQLINVLIGDMSIIGPRPEREVFYVKFEKDIPNFRDRLIVKPGLTGYAQVNGGYDLNPSEKLDLDLFYIQNNSIFLDMKILFKTLKVVLTGEGAR